jgi:hypothetical protein
MLTVIACTGAIGDPGGGVGGRPHADPDEPAAGIAGSTALRRLTNAEYEATVHDLFGIDGAAASFPIDPRVQGLERNADGLVTTAAHVERWSAAAEKLAQAIDLGKVASCAAIDAACVDDLLSRLGRRILRRPLEASERGQLAGVWETLRPTQGEEPALRAVLARLLQAPEFLYHVELGGPDGRLDGFEIAQRLSFLIRGTTPDDALLDAAARGDLDDDAGLEAVAAQMLEDPAAKANFLRFVEQWLDIDTLDRVTKDPKIHPGFDKLKPLLRKEFDRFVEHTIFGGDGALSTLLSANFTFANADLAPLYGATATGPEFVRIDLDPTQRAGILTSGAFLAVHGKADRSAPISRGVFVLQRLLCTEVPPPPPGASSIPPDAPPAKTTRAFFEGLTERAPCLGCHRQINDLGFGFERYDAIGRFRTDEGGEPIDARGGVDVGDVAGPFVGAVELAQRMAKSATVRRCAATHWFRWTHERLERAGDAAAIDGLDRALQQSGGRLRDLPRAVVRAPGFRHAHWTSGGAQ